MYQLVNSLMAWWKDFMAPPDDVAYCLDWHPKDHEARVIAIHIQMATNFYKLEP